MRAACQRVRRAGSGAARRGLSGASDARRRWDTAAAALVAGGSAAIAIWAGAQYGTAEGQATARRSRFPPVSWSQRVAAADVRDAADGGGARSAGPPPGRRDSQAVAPKEVHTARDDSSLAFGGTGGLALTSGGMKAVTMQRKPSESRVRQMETSYIMNGEKRLGSGGNAVVKSGRHRRNGEAVAIKIMSKELTSAARVGLEAQILRMSGDHRGIISFKDLFEDEKHYFLVMELASGGELFERLISKGAYSERDAAKVFREVLQAVRFLHQQNVVHFDIKPENILLKDQRDDVSDIRLVDFGSAARVDGGPVVRRAYGTVAYSAPEMLRGEPCGPKADVWSLGVILYILLSGTHPFDLDSTGDDDVVRRNILSGELNFEDKVWGAVSRDAVKLLLAMMDRNPEKRPDVCAVLSGGWLKGSLEGESAELLEGTAEKLRVLVRGRRRLKALLTAAMIGLVDESLLPPATARDSASHSLAAGELVSPLVHSSASHVLGSRASAVRLMDRSGKGSIDARDLKALALALGEDLTEGEVQEMLEANAMQSKRRRRRRRAAREAAGAIYPEDVYSMMPPMAPPTCLRRGEQLFRQGAVDDTFYVLTEGDMRLEHVHADRAPSLWESLHRGLRSVQGVPGRLLGAAEAAPPEEEPPKAPPSTITIGPRRLVGHLELMNADGSTTERWATATCASERCKAIALAASSFSSVTDALEGVDNRLRAQTADKVAQLLREWLRARDGSVLRLAAAAPRVDAADALLVCEGAASAVIAYADGRRERCTLREGDFIVPGNGMLCLAQAAEDGSMVVREGLLREAARVEGVAAIGDGAAIKVVGAEHVRKLLAEPGARTLSHFLY